MHRLQDGRLTANVQEGFLLSSERGFRQIFRGRRGAHGDRDLLAVAHLAKLFEHRLFNLGREGCRENPAADFRPGGGEFRDIVDVEPGQFGANAGVQAALFQELTVGVRCCGEAAGYLHTELCQRANHLAEGGVFTAHRLDIVHSEPLERDHIGVQ